MATSLPKARPARRRAAGGAGDEYGATAAPDWRETDWRAHLRTAEIAGRSVNYVDVDVGEAREGTVVFIHGLSGSWQNWLENIPRFALHRRVVALDLPGFGESQMPADGISIAGYARCVDELCEQLGLGSVAVVGNSMGGFVGAEVAIGFPQRVERLCLVSAAGISIVDLRREPLLAVGRILAAGGTMTAAQQRSVLRRPGLTHLTFAFVFRHPTRLDRDLLLEQMQGTGKPGFLGALDALTSYDFRDRLPEIGCPSLIVWGDGDMLVPVKDAGEFERLIPDARKTIFEDTGHCAMLERPEAFNACLADFLAEKGSAAEHDESPAAA
ncbi:MAG: alpha/beta fold hydrolase [Thermoleophilaceae bacterium]